MYQHRRPHSHQQHQRRRSSRTLDERSRWRRVWYARRQAPTGQVYTTTVVLTGQEGSFLSMYEVILCQDSECKRPLDIFSDPRVLAADASQSSTYSFWDSSRCLDDSYTTACATSSVPGARQTTAFVVRSDVEELVRAIMVVHCKYA